MIFFGLSFLSFLVPVDQELDSLLDELNNVSEFFNHEQLNKANYFNDLCEATERVDYEENLFSQQDKGPEMQNIKYQSNVEVLNICDNIHVIINYGKNYL